MLTYTLPETERPEYHAGMLLVKVRPTVDVRATFAAGVGAGVAAGEVQGFGATVSSGMSMLASLERAGRVRRVTPLARAVERELAATSMSAGSSSLGHATFALAASAAQPAVDDALAGVSLIEVDAAQEVTTLQVSLATDPNVEFVSRVPVRYLMVPARRGRDQGEPRRSQETPRSAAPAAAPPPAANLWNLEKIKWQQARTLPGFRNATDVKVAVLDTGVQQDHPDLTGRVRAYSYAHPDLPNVSSARDIVGHGTHVCGIIAAGIGNGLGINGICECDLRVWKIFTDQTTFISYLEGFGYVVDPIMYRRALAECLAHEVDVVNLSIGGTARPDAQEEQLFRLLLARGTTVVAAMGNWRQLGSPAMFPGAIPGVIAVGASTIDDSVTNFSNAGSHISIVAPGLAIWSTLPAYAGQTGFYAIPDGNGQPKEGKPKRRETDYDAWPGTSMASPHVAAATALLLANRGAMTPAQVRDRLMATADRVPLMARPPTHDPDYGAGRLNLLRLLQA